MWNGKVMLNDEFGSIIKLLFRHLLGGIEEDCHWVYRLRNEPTVNFIQKH
jgi:hypothetical protein